jgi:hypothetical protein
MPEKVKNSKPWKTQTKTDKLKQTALTHIWKQNKKPKDQAKTPRTKCNEDEQSGEPRNKGSPTTNLPHEFTVGTNNICNAQNYIQTKLNQRRCHTLIQLLTHKANGYKA